jgi:hypothetical protein
LIWGQYILGDSDEEPASYSGSSKLSHLGFLRYPYADDQHGWFVTNLDKPDDPTQPATVHLRFSSGAVRTEYTDSDDEVHRWAGAAHFNIDRLRLEAELHRYLEYLPNDRTDSLTIVTAGLSLAFPMENAVTLLLGGGVSNYHDAYGNVSGWYVKTGLELFPIQPVIITADVWVGSIREDEYDTASFLGGGRATAGVIWNRYEIYGGWQALWIGSVTLDGPTAGIRVWF